MVAATTVCSSSAENTIVWGPREMLDSSPGCWDASITQHLCPALGNEGMAFIPLSRAPGRLPGGTGCPLLASVLLRSEADTSETTHCRLHLQPSVHTRQPEVRYVPPLKANLNDHQPGSWCESPKPCEPSMGVHGRRRVCPANIRSPRHTVLQLATTILHSARHLSRFPGSHHNPARVSLATPSHFLSL